MTGLAMVVALGAGELYDADPRKLAPSRPFAVASRSAPAEWVRAESAVFPSKLPPPVERTMMQEMALRVDRALDRLTRMSENVVDAVTGAPPRSGPFPGRCCGRRC
jgi:hypothetical protein